jgi:hypothetical protein
MNVDARGSTINNVRGAQTNNHFSIIVNDQPSNTPTARFEVCNSLNTNTLYADAIFDRFSRESLWLKVKTF